MPRGPRKHMKRLNAPSHWMLDKMGGTWAPRPSTGPHKLRECVPLAILIRNRLKYALTFNEVKKVLSLRAVHVDAKVRTDHTFPTGFQDVISIEKSNDYFRMLYDTKGRFVLHRIPAKEAEFKLCKVKRCFTSKKGIPAIVTHDGRTIRYADPDIDMKDTVKVDLATNKVVEFTKFDIGKIAMVTGGQNVGRVGEIVHRERHPGAFDMIHIRDARGHEFSTRDSNVFVIGADGKTQISLPAKKGIAYSIIEEREARLKKSE